ncbi:unnamed protein product [Paramecium primaurelia]|uniref:Uncharacterized protein n=1 Tax=Paramecium primaurelia TaxID=5886 RepID=A0A8S1QQY7_PARPR|nr:unnamed protein product [Paramecium primaurelia]
MLGISLLIQLTEYKKTIFKESKLPDFPKIKKLGLRNCKTSYIVEIQYQCIYNLQPKSLKTPSVKSHSALQPVSGTFQKVQVRAQIGFGDIKRAKQYVAVGILISVLICALCGYFNMDLLIIYSRKRKGLISRQNKRSIETIPWVFLIVDGFQGTLSGALKEMLSRFSLVLKHICIFILLCSY